MKEYMNNKFIESFVKRVSLWYQYNKQKIPTILTLIGTFFYTFFVDYHIKVISNSNSYLISLLMFVLFFLSVVHIPNALNVSKKRSLFSNIFYALFTLLYIFLTYIYINDYIKNIVTGQQITGEIRKSFIFLIIPNIFYILASIFGFIYLDKNYKRVKDE